MSKNILFKTDQQTKDMLQEISATFGVKYSIVEEVWQYTVFSMLLRVADKENGLIRITLPYIGTLGLRDKGSVMSNNGSISSDIEAFASLSDSFKDMFQKVRNGSYGELSDYLKANYIDKTIDNIDSRKD